MEGYSLSHTATWTSSYRQNNVNDYINIIRACYRRFPDSFHYYEQLVEYLGSPVENRVASSLQVPKVFVNRDCCDEEIPYFPFRIENGNLTNTVSPRQPPQVTITVLEGFPSPDCIASLGSRLSLRPELFLGHLDPYRKLSPRDLKSYYKPPALPSLQDNVVHVQFINLVRSLTESGAAEVSAKRRVEWQNSCRRSEVDLFSERKFGVARFRRIHIHNPNFFSAEQMLSFGVCKRDDDRWEGKWQLPISPVTHETILRLKRTSSIKGVYLSDNGRSLTDDRHFPWSSSKPTTGRPLGSIPILAYNFPFNSQCPDLQSNDDIALDEDLASTLDQFHPLKTVVVASELDHALLISDPFFILSSVLNVANLAWAQLINFLADDISYYKSAGDSSSDAGGNGNLNFALEQLRFDAGLLERTSAFLSDNLVLIKQGGSPSWPKPAATATTLLAHKAKIQAALERNVEHLVARCERLARSCELSTTFLVSSMQLIESQKGITQAGQVQRLTQLAFLFIPISLLASVFGMNVAEYKNPPRIWVFFLIAAVMFGVTCLGLGRQVLMSQVRRLRRHLLGGRAHVTE